MPDPFAPLSQAPSPSLKNGEATAVVPAVGERAESADTIRANALIWAARHGHAAVVRELIAPTSATPIDEQVLTETLSEAVELFGLLRRKTIQPHPTGCLVF